jgi:hypothetical protein
MTPAQSRGGFFFFFSFFFSIARSLKSRFILSLGRKPPTSISHSSQFIELFC